MFEPKTHGEVPNSGEVVYARTLGSVVLLDANERGTLLDVRQVRDADG
jgi:hypothetical protein